MDKSLNRFLNVGRYRQRLSKLIEQEEEISILQRNIQHLTERNTELEKEVWAFKTLFTSLGSLPVLFIYIY